MRKLFKNLKKLWHSFQKMSVSVINDNIASTGTTSGLTPLNILSYSLSEIDNCSAKATVSVIGRDQSNGNTVGWEYKFMAKRTNGNVSIVGIPYASMPQQADISVLASVVTISTSGSEIKVSTTGVLLANMEWYAQMNISIISHNE